MKLQDSLLLIVDVQKGFINENTENVIPVINKLTQHWQRNKRPIVYSRFINLPGSNYKKLLDWTRLQHEPETNLAENLKVHSEYVFKKSTYTAWSTEIVSLCQRDSVQDIVICGVDTNECVLATAFSVFDAGFTPWVVTDACASMGGKESHDMAIKLLQTIVGKPQLITSKELL